MLITCSKSHVLEIAGVSLVAQLVKNLPAMQSTWVWSLGWEVPLEKGKTTHSSWSSSCMVLEQLWGDTPCPRAEKPQQDGRYWCGSCVALERLWGDSPHPRAKEKPQQDCRRGKITFWIKPHSCQRCLEGSNKPCVHQNPETPQRLTELCLIVSCGVTGQQWTAARAGAMGAADLGMA